MLPSLLFILELVFCRILAQQLKFKMTHATSLWETIPKCNQPDYVCKFNAFQGERNVAPYETQKHAMGTLQKCDKKYTHLYS